MVQSSYALDSQLSARGLDLNNDGGGLGVPLREGAPEVREEQDVPPGSSPPHSSDGGLQARMVTSVPLLGLSPCLFGGPLEQGQCGGHLASLWLRMLEGDCSSGRSGSGRRALLACPLSHSLLPPSSPFAYLLREVAVAQRLRPGLRWAGPGWGGVHARSGLSSPAMKPRSQMGWGSSGDLGNPVCGNPGQVGAGLGSDSESYDV